MHLCFDDADATHRGAQDEIDAMLEVSTGDHGVAAPFLIPGCTIPLAWSVRGTGRVYRQKLERLLMEPAIAIPPFRVYVCKRAPAINAKMKRHGFDRRPSTSQVVH